MAEYKGTFRSKLPQTGVTIFTIMSALANEHSAINLSQGFPNFPVDEKLTALVYEQMKKGFNQYAPMAGVMTLRERIAEKVQSLYNAVYNPETEITITAGGTQALFTSIMALVREGDEVIIFDPAYDSYAPSVILAGGIPIHIDLKAPDFKINWTVVKKMINQRTRMIIINSPQNPTGSILSAKDLQQLEKLTTGSDIVVLSDEVYEHIIFDNNEHQSVLRYPKLAERSFVVFSFGKTFHATGWKTGYVLAPANLMTEFRKVHQFNVFAANTPIQYALAEYMSDKNNYTGLDLFYQQKRNQFQKMLEGSRFGIMPCSGSYFQLLDFSAITHEKDTEFAKRLTIENKVASVPISVFYQRGVDNKILRFCFAKDDATLEQAAERLLKI